MIAAGELGPLHFVHGAYLQDWLLEATDFSWRLEPDKGGAELRDRRHRIALVRSRRSTSPACGSVRSSPISTTVIETRLKPAGSTEAFAQRTRDAVARAVDDHRRGSRDGAAALRRRREGQRLGRPGLRRPQERICGSRSAGRRRRCAGSRSGRTSCGSASAHRANEVLAEGSVAAQRRPRAATRTCPAATRKAGPTRSAT